MKLTFDQKCACFKAQSRQLIERLVSNRIYLSADMSLVCYRSARKKINTQIKDKLIENLAKEIAYTTKHRLDGSEILEKATTRAKRYGPF